MCGVRKYPEQADQCRPADVEKKEVDMSHPLPEKRRRGTMIWYILYLDAMLGLMRYDKGHFRIIHKPHALYGVGTTLRQSLPCARRMQRCRNLLKAPVILYSVDLQYGIKIYKTAPTVL